PHGADLVRLGRARLGLVHVVDGLHVGAQRADRTRHTARGSTRKTAKAAWRMAGAYTTSALRWRPLTMASATASGWVANGCAAMPSVMRVCTKPGRTTMTRPPLP